MDKKNEKTGTSFQNYGWRIFFSATMLIYILFFLLLLSVQSIWYDINRFINDMTSLSVNWILLIAILIIGVTCLEIYRYLNNFTNFTNSTNSNSTDSPRIISEGKKKPKLADIIRAVFFIIFCIALTIVLISEMGNETELIAYGFRSLLPWVLFGIILSVFISIQPKLAPLWKKPLKLKTKAIGVNFLLGILLISSVAYINNPQMGASIMKTEPYLQIKGENSLSIMWLTNPEVVSWVEYGTDEILDKKVYGVNDGYKEVSQISKVKINNLTAGTTYYYRVFSQEVKQIHPLNVIFGKTVESDLYQFTTPQADSEDISFLVFADIHEQNQLYSPLLNLGGQNPYDLVFLDGDVLNHVDSPQQIAEQMITPLTDEFASEIPFVFIRGNHETRGELSRQFIDYIDTPNEKYYYSFDQGPVHFTILDSGEDKEDSHEEYSGLNDFESYREEQTAWLQNEVTSEAYLNATYRIVFVHCPLNEYLEEPNSTTFREYQRIWCEILNSTGADIIISGHHHENKLYSATSEFNPFDFSIIVTGGYEPENEAILRCDITAIGLDLYVLKDNGTPEGERILEYALAP